jgi:hypothetical protein
VVNNICDNALLYGYAAGARMITRDIVEEVIETLDLYPRAASYQLSAVDDEANSRP